jgi:hypothetical protein
MLVVFAVILLGTATGCPAPRTSGPGDDGPPFKKQQQAEPGFDFTLHSPGLPVKTLEYISQEPTALAGARGSGQVFFALSEDTDEPTRIYRRDLNTGGRELVAEIEKFIPGSMTVSSDGSQLVYNRYRETTAFIDDPFISYPRYVVLVYRMDTASGETELVFDFREEELKPYRSDHLVTFISDDGRRIYALAYQVAELHLARQIEEWMSIDADATTNANDKTQAELDTITEELRTLLTMEHVAPRLRELGVEPLAEGPVTEEEREALRKLYTEVDKPRAALLIWEDGQARALPLSIPEERDYLQHMILAAGNETVLLVAPDPSVDPIDPEPVFDVDLETGEVSRIGEFSGSTSTIELDQAEENLVLVINPVDPETREVKPETQLELVPLDGSEHVIQPLGHDYFGIVHHTADHEVLVAQDRDDKNAYIVNTADGSRTLLKEFLAPLESIFLADDREHLAFSMVGILMSAKIPPEPEASPGWTTDEHIAEYLPKVTGFFSELGFEIPADVNYDWEDRASAVSRELAIHFVNPDYPERIVLARYLVERDEMAAVWFPGPYPFDLREPLTTEEELDYYAIEDIVRTALDRVGWTDPQTRELYQPGSSPLHDGRTNSYIIVFRDGYWLDDETWVYNQEVTSRVLAGSGRIAELTYSNLDEVADQPIELSVDDAAFIMRNEGEQPLPDDESIVKIDRENYRLVVHQKRREQWTDTGYELALDNRLCYEIDAYIQPENELIMTARIDTETGEMMGQIDFLPDNIPLVPQTGAGGAQ